MSVRTAPPGAAVLWQLAARFASPQEPVKLSLFPPRPAVIPLILSLSEDSKMIDGSRHYAGRSQRTALICKAKNKTKKGIDSVHTPVIFFLVN
jgi:hypothetical protein